MKRHLASITIVALLLVGWAARAYTYSTSEGEGGTAEAPAAEHKQDVPGYIMHHLMDSEEVEFEVPLPHTEGVVLHFSEWFQPLLFERVPGSCSAPVDKAFAAFPGLGKWTAGCWDLRPTKATFFMWVAAFIVLFLVVVLARRKPEQLVPAGRGQHIVEVLLLYVRDEIAVKNIGKEHASRYTPYLASVFFFILTMNWLGLIPGMATPTGNIAITAGLAIITFLLTQVASIRSAGLGGYLKHLTGGVPIPMWPIMIPVEFLGLFTKPFALTVRLFANMLAGHTVLFFLLALIFMLHPAMAVMAVPMATGVFLLEIFVGIVQAYIFTMLSALFIGQGVAMGHHHDEHGEEAHGH